MRIIAGLFRGRLLEYPPALETRPTTDRVREALFSMLASRIEHWQSLRVLDAFAGSGAMGLEALSRGACFTHFIEQSKVTLKTLVKNIETLGVKAHTLIEKGNFFKTPLHGPFDLVFLDPPYHHTYIDESLKLLETPGLLSQEAWVVCEMSIKDAPVVPSTYTIIATRRFGSIKVIILRYC